MFYQLWVFFFFFSLITTWIFEVDIKNNNLHNEYFILGCIVPKHGKIYNILILQLIFIFITTSSLPKHNKLSKNCDSNNNNKSKSFLNGFVEYKSHQTL